MAMILLVIVLGQGRGESYWWYQLVVQKTPRHNRDVPIILKAGPGMERLSGEK
jgi:hypothetical protein